MLCLLSGLQQAWAQGLLPSGTTYSGTPNTAPKVANQSLVTTMGVALPILLSAVDAEGDELIYTVTTFPAHGMLTGTAPNLIYTPDPGYTGTDLISYLVTDGEFAVTAQTFLEVNPTAKYRINAGGGKLVTEHMGTYDADSYYFPNPGYTYANYHFIDKTDNDALYQTERSSPADNGSFVYTFPVDNGQYYVVLHFAESYWYGAGKRVFDVSAEGALILDNYDIYKKAGGNFTPITETFVVDVTDRSLEILFSALASEGGVNRPKVSAIEIISTLRSNQFPSANAGPDKTITLPVSSVVLEGSGSDLDGYIERYGWIQESGPIVATFSSQQEARPTISNLEAGTYVFTLTVKDDQGAVSKKDQVSITVLPDPNAPQPRYRINAGGPRTTNLIGTFAEDNSFAPLPGYAFSTTQPIAGTRNDNIYQTERASHEDNGSFTYNLPLDNGQYYVVLHFAEFYWHAVGQRVFDVAAEGTLVLDNYDIVKKTGTNFTATTETFVADVADGSLDLLFSALASEGGVNRPKVSAIEVYPYPSAKQNRITLENAIKAALAAPETETGPQISAYPNPFDREIKLSLVGTKAGRYSVRILDFSGRLVYQEEFTSGPLSGPVHTISLENKSLTSRGLYLVEVKEVNGLMRKVIKVMKK